MATLKLYTCTSIECNQYFEFYYAETFTGSQFMQVACYNMNSYVDSSYRAIFLNQFQQECTLSFNETLSNQGVIDGMLIYILPPTEIRHIPGSIQISYNASNGNASLPEMVLPTTNNPAVLPNLPPLPQLPQLASIAPSFVLPELLENFKMPEIPNFNMDLSSDFNILNFQDVYKPPQYDAMANESTALDDLDVVIKNNDAGFDASEFATVTNVGFDGSNAGDKDESNTVMMYTYNGFTFNNEPPTRYNISDSFQEVCQKATDSLGLRNGDYAILLVFSEDDKRWFEPNTFLEDYSCYDGMKLSLFKKNIKIQIESPHFDSYKSQFDITKSVSEIVKEIALSKRIDNYLGFTLYYRKNEIDRKTGNMKSKTFPLDQEVCVPYQIESFNELVFQRRFFVFSYEDFESTNSSLIAFTDARDEVRHNRIMYLTEDEAINVAAYGYFTENPRSSIESIPDNLSSYLPRHYPGAKKIGKYVRSRFQNDTILTVREYARLYIKSVRLCPGFAAEKYSCQTEPDSITCYCIINPHVLMIVDSENSDVLYNVRFNSMIDIVSESGLLTINYLGFKREYQTISLRSKYSSEISTIVMSYQRIQREILQTRAKLRAKGQSIAPISSMDKITLETFNGFNDPNPIMHEYDSNFTGSMLLDVVINLCKIKDKVSELSILCQMHRQKRWIPNDQTLAQVGVYDGCLIYVVKTTRPVRIQMTDQSSRLMPLNLRLTADDLIKDIFARLHAPFILGYSLYFFIDDKAVPLDGRFSIPEQTTSFEVLLFKRRFYILSRDDLQSDILGRAAFSDCQNYILNENIDVPEPVALELALLALYINFRDPNEISLMKTFNYETMFPKCIKITSSLKKSFSKLVETYEKIDNRKAVRKYLGIVRDIPFFGAEVYNVMLREAGDQKQTSKQFKEAVIKVCPLYTFILETNGKVLYRIPWRLVINYRIFKASMVLTFANKHHGTPLVYEIKSSEVNKLVLMISGSLTIFRTMILTRQKIQQLVRAETILKLQGGYTDEKGNIHGPMMNFHITPKLDVLKKFTTLWFDLSWTQEEIVQVIIEKCHLEKKQSIEYGLMFMVAKGNYRWLMPGQILSSIDPVRGSILFVFNIKPIIKIGTATGVQKSMYLNLSLPLKKLIKVIGAKFETSQCEGYTLYSSFLKPGSGLLPLDLSKRIPEQISNFEGMIFRRRFFVLSKIDFSHFGSLLQTFCDIRELVLSGVMEVGTDHAVELLYYSITVDNKKPLLEDQLPQDLVPHLPVGIKPNRNMPKQLKQLWSTIKIKDTEDAMTRYIALARSLPTFGCEKYMIKYQDIVKGKSILKDASLLVTPNRVIAIDDTTKKEVCMINYEYLLQLQSIENIAYFRYCDNKEKLYFFEAISEMASSIMEVINTYILIKGKILKRRAKEAITFENTTGSDRIAIFTYHGLVANEEKRIFIYDQRMNGDQLLDKAISNLSISPKGQYMCLLRFTNKDKYWVGSKSILGLYHPYDGISMQVYDRFAKFSISGPDGSTKRMALDVSSLVSSLIPYICERYSIKNSIGYTLFSKKVSGEETPLDLGKSIPEQADFDEIFVLKRRFFVISKFDIMSYVWTRELYNDFKSHVLSGIPEVNEAEMLELAVYQIFAEAVSPDVAKSIKEISDVSKFLPLGMVPKPKYSSKIIELVTTSPDLSHRSAISQYIRAARQLIGFGSFSFESTIREKSKDKKGKEVDSYIEVIVSIGANGIIIYISSTKKALYKFSIKDIITIQGIRDVLLLRASIGEETQYLFLKSHNADEMLTLILSYSQIILPAIKMREKIQKAGIIDPYESTLSEGLISVVIRSDIGDRFPVEVTIDHKLLRPQVFDYLSQVYSLPSTNDYVMFSIMNDGSVHHYEDDMTIGLFCSNINNLYFMNPQKSVYVLSSFGFINRQLFDITMTIAELTTSLSKKLDLGFEDGFTLYSGEPKEYPQDIKYCLPFQTEHVYDLSLRRRFYVFTDHFLRDSVSISSLYFECKKSILKREIITNDDQAIELAAISIYCEVSSLSEFVNAANKCDLRSLLPSSIPISSIVNRKFRAICKSLAPMSGYVACLTYISKCSALKGYGCEYHEISFTVKSDISKKSNRNGIIVLSPFSISITKGEKVYINIPYNKIIKYNRENTDLVYIKYYNEVEWIHSIQICSTETQYIWSFISTMMYYMDVYGSFMSQNQFSTTICSIIKGQTHDEISTLQIDLIEDDQSNIDDINIDVSFKFDDNNQIDFTGVEDPLGFMKNCYDDYSLGNKDYGNNLPAFNLPTSNVINDEISKDMGWRLSDNGLILSRADRMLDSIYDDAFSISNGLSSENPESLCYTINLLNESLQYISAAIPEYMQKDFNDLNEQLSKLREVSQTVLNSDQNMNNYQATIKAQLNGFINSISPAKQAIQNSLNGLRIQHQTQMGSISQGLIGISDAEESLAAAITCVSPQISSIGHDPWKIIDRIHNSSFALTNMASSFSQSTDPFVYEIQIVPQLKEIKSSLTDIMGITSNLQHNDPDVIKIADYCNKMNSYLNEFEASIVQFSKSFKASQQNISHVYTGNSEALSSSIQQLIVSRKYLDGLLNQPVMINDTEMKNNIIESRNQIDSIIKGLIQNQKVKSDLHNNDESSYEVQKAISILISTKQQLPVSIAPHISAQIDQIVKPLSTTANAISTSHIVPSSLSKVIDDISLLQNRYKDLDTRIWKSFDPLGLQQVDDTFKLLNEKIESFKSINNKLQECVIDNTNVRSAQDELLKLKIMSDDLQKSINLICKNTNDFSYQVMIERIFTDLNNVLIENPPSEDIQLCPHILSLQQMHVDLAHLINAMSRTISLESIKANAPLLGRLQVVYNLIQKFYEGIVQERMFINESPFDREVLNHSIIELQKGLKFISLLQSMSVDVTELTSNNDLYEKAKISNNYIVNTIDLLRNVPGSVYREKPTETHISTICESIDQINRELLKAKSSSEVLSNQPLLSCIEKELSFFNRQKSILKSLRDDEMMIIYDIAEKISKRIEILPDAFKDHPKISSLSFIPSIIPTSIAPMKMVLKSRAPTVDLVKEEIINSSQQISSLSKCINDRILCNQSDFDPTIVENARLLVEKLNNSASDLILHSQNNDYNGILAKQDKRILNEIQVVISNIPTPIRTAITSDSNENLISSLGLTSQSCSQAICAIRNLPTKGVVKIDSKAFSRIDQETEVSDSINDYINQVTSFQSILSSIKSMPQLESRPHTYKLISDLNDMFLSMSKDIKSASQNEDHLLLAIGKAKDLFPKVITSIELVTPIIGLTSLNDISKNLSQNAMILQKQLSIHHLSPKSGAELCKLIKPQLEQLSNGFKTIIIPSVLPPTVVSTISNFFESLPEKADSIQSSRLKIKQKACDELYSSLLTIIPNMIEHTQFEPIIDGVFYLNDTLSRFTSLPLQNTRYTNGLYVKSVTIDPILTQRVVEQISSSIIKSQIPQNDNIFEITEENLHTLADHFDSVPLYISKALPSATRVLRGHPSNTLTSVAISLLGIDQYMAKLSLLEELTISSYTKSSEVLERLKEFIHKFDSWNDLPIKLSFHLNTLKKLIGSVDTRLLFKCQSLSAAVLMFNVFHQIVDQLSILSFNKALFCNDGILSSVTETGEEFAQWVFGSDLILVNCFYSHIDELVQCLEELLTNDKSLTLSSLLSPVLRQWAIILKSKDRLLSMNWINLMKISKQYLGFETDIYPQVYASASESESKQKSSDLIKSLEKFKPVLRLWSSPANETSTSFCFSMDANSSSFRISSKEMIKLSSEDPHSFSKLFYQKKSNIAQISITYQHGIDNGVIVKGLSEVIPQINSLISAVEKTESTHGSMRAQLVNILESSLQKLMAFVESEIHVDYSKASIDISSQNQQSISSLELITDQNCLSIAKTSQTYLAGLIKKASIIEVNYPTAQTQTSYNSLHHLNSIPTLSSYALTRPIGQRDQQFPKSISIEDSYFNKSLSNSLIISSLVSLQHFHLYKSPEIVKLISNQQYLTDFVKNLPVSSIEESIDSISAHLSMFSDQLRLADEIARQTTSQELIDYIMINYLLDIIQGPCSIVDASPLESQKNQYTASLISRISNNNCNGTDITPLMISNTIFSSITITESINCLLSLYHSLCTNCPSVFKFISTKEGFYHFHDSIPMNDVRECQKLISKQITLLNTPSILQSIQLEFYPEQVSNQIRIIQFILTKIVSSEFCHHIQADSHEDFVKSLLLDLVSLYPSNPNILLSKALIDIDLIMKTQSLLFEKTSQIEIYHRILDMNNEIRQFCSNKGIDLYKNEQTFNGDSNMMDSIISFALLPDRNRSFTEFLENSSQTIALQVNCIMHNLFSHLFSDSIDYSIFKCNQDSTSSIISGTLKPISTQIIPSTSNLLSVLHHSHDSLMPSSIFTKSLDSYSTAIEFFRVAEIMKSNNFAFSDSECLSKWPQIIQSAPQVNYSISLIDSLRKAKPEQYRSIIDNTERSVTEFAYGLINSSLNEYSMSNQELQKSYCINEKLFSNAGIQALSNSDIVHYRSLSDLSKQITYESSLMNEIEFVRGLLYLLNQSYVLNPSLGFVPAPVDSINSEMFSSIRNLIFEANTKNSPTMLFSKDTSQSQILLIRGVLYLIINEITRMIQDPSFIKSINFGINQLYQVSSDKIYNDIKGRSQISSPQMADSIILHKLFETLYQQSNLRYDLLNFQFCFLEQNPQIIELTRDPEFYSKFSTKDILRSQEILWNCIKCGGVHRPLIDSIRALPSEQIMCILSSSVKIVHSLDQNSPNKPLSNISLGYSLMSDEIPPPSEKEAYMQVAQSVTNMLNLIPSISMVPISECHSILASESSSLIQVLRSLLNHKGTSYPVDVRSLLDNIPQILATMIRVLPTLDDRIRQSLDIDPNTIMPMIQTLVLSSIHLNDPSSKKTFHSTVEKLLLLISCVNASVQNSIDIDPISILTDLALSFKKYDAELIDENLIKLQALKLQCLALNKPIPNIEKIDTIISNISPIITELHSKQIHIPTDVQKKLDNNRSVLVDMISKESKDPLDIIQGLSNCESLRGSFRKFKSDFDAKLQSIIKNYSKYHSNNGLSNHQGLIELVMNAQSTYFQHLLNSNSDSFSIYSDYMSMFSSTVTSIATLNEALDNPSTSPSIIKRASRSLSRMMNSISEIIEDNDVFLRKPNSSSEIDVKKSQVMGDIGLITQIIMSTISSYDSCKIPETYLSLSSRHMKDLKSQHSKLINDCNDLLKLNADKNAAIIFEELRNNVFSCIDIFIINSQRVSSLATLQNYLNAFSNSIPPFVTSVSQLTDVVPIEPDLEASDLLINKYYMPAIPSDLSTKKISEAYSILVKGIDTFCIDFDSFIVMCTNINSKNLFLASSMNDLAKLMNDVIIQILRVSMLTTTLQYQNELTNSAYSLAKTLDSLVSSLRDRFLLRGDWSISSSPKISLMKTLFDQVKQSGKEAESIAIKEETSRDQVVIKYINALQPLSIISSKVDSLSEELSSQPTSISREWSLQMLSLGSALCKAANKILLHSKDHSSNANRIDSLTSFSRSVCAEAENLCASVNSLMTGSIEEPENLVITIMNKFSQLATEYSKNNDSKNTEENALREAILIVSRTANSLVSSAESVIKQKQVARTKAANKESGSPKGSGQSKMPAQTKEQLLKRLNLESKVIKARTLLERGEKQLSMIV